MGGLFLAEVPCVHRNAQGFAVVAIEAEPGIHVSRPDDGRAAAQRVGAERAPVVVDAAVAAPVVEELEIDVDVAAEAGAVPAVIVVGPLVQVGADKPEDLAGLLPAAVEPEELAVPIYRSLEAHVVHFQSGRARVHPGRKAPVAATILSHYEIPGEAVERGASGIV